MTGKLQCDLVMRGGITSGIVYPRAVAKLAETYDFRSIGGTSAGAIAAAATAAAALGRRNGKDHFQAEIRELPETLAEKRNGKTVLERLFQPQPKTRRLFGVLMAGLGRETMSRKVARVITAVCRGYWRYLTVAFLLALLPFLGLALLLGLSGAAFWLLVASAASLALLVAVLVAGYELARDIIDRLPENNYGLCSGSSNGVADEAGILPLTDWLHEFFQTVAGRKAQDTPVTFGELWDNGGNPNAPRDIELVLMTTNITRGISQRLPFLEGSWGQLFFKREEFEKLFPASVVESIREHPAEIRQKDAIEVPEGYHPLPAPKDLPILLGARMSLSFPFLLSAVPLYAADVTKRSSDGKFELERCWFSDGGLTSNFPIHFFDAPLPSRPTFAINLVPETVAVGDVTDDGGKRSVRGLEAGGASIGARLDARWKNIYMPSTNASGIGATARFNKFIGIIGFFSALFDTARNWGDTELMAMPGYRDRIVHVGLSKDEGGLNLNMDDEVILRVAERGERAGELLAARFSPEPGNDPQTGESIVLTWDNHRWVRYRSVMAALEELIKRFRATWLKSEEETRWRSYVDLAGRKPSSPPRSYPFGNLEQRAFALDATKAMVNFVEGWGGDHTFDRGESSKEGRSPYPKPVLRAMPPGSNDPRA
jgi:predicted acylesterase/phospholipase RssA